MKKGLKGLEKVLEVLKTRKYNTKKRVEEFNEIERAIEGFEGVNTIKRVLVYIGESGDYGYEGYYRNGMYYGLVNGSIGVWLFTQGDLVYKGSMGRLIEENRIVVKNAVKYILKFINELENVSLNEKSIYNLIAESKK